MENGGKAAKSGGQGAASSWDIWELGNWSSAAIAAGQSSSTSYSPHAIASSSSSPCPPFADHAAAVPTAPGDHHRVQGHQYGLQHQHLTCLKLGKRPYYGEEGLAGGGIKRERPSPNRAAGAPVPRCQVEGCNKALVDAKDYHKRHKVCEMHSKAPKVVVLGAEQRFCQQCSRFHVISEFDDSKRSCRRRLAGHNERRRKSTNDSIRNSSLENTMVGSRFPYIPTSPGRALSLLSSKASPWVSTSELSSRSSAALRELILENRAAVLARQLFSSDRGGWHSMGSENQANLSYVQHEHQVPSQPQAQLADGWNQFQEAGSHVTLDLMQMPGSSFEILSGRRKSKEEEEECCEIWKSLEGTHVV